jgi:nicotinamidase-related amidase
MSEALMIIDAQSPWDTGNRKTVQAIQAALPAFRERMPVIWVFKTDDGDDFQPTQLKGRSLPDLFSEKGRQYLMPSLHPRSTDFVTAKKEMDAFTNPRLKPFLKRMGIDHIYLAGFKTGMCVYKTGCTAAAGDPLGLDRQFNVHLLLPLTADSDDRIEPPHENYFESQGITLCNNLEMVLGKRYAAPAYNSNKGHRYDCPSSSL